MMDQTDLFFGSRADEGGINLIEPDPPLIADWQGTGAGTYRIGQNRFEQREADALAARRRREFDAARERLRDQAIQAGAFSQASLHGTAPAGAQTAAHPDLQPPVYGP